VDTKTKLGEWLEITKEVFLRAYNKNLPNGWTKFAFKYFSQSTKKEDKWISRIIRYILISLFALGFLGAVLDLNNNYMLMTIIPFVIILAGIVMPMLGGFLMNINRIRKIRKELGGITAQQYNLLALMYIE
jgi:hypothetical protein